MGQVIAPKVDSLPKSVTLSVTTVISGKNVTLGFVKTNGDGLASIPGFYVKKPGTYLIQLTNNKGRKYFIKVLVSAKKL